MEKVAEKEDQNQREGKLGYFDYVDIMWKLHLISC